ncbi:MAG: PKD domain-containing protein, partial [Deltaproteobacteria bacterium]|nr:PKD domain-containing protein [Deltaproteobacteria bacterium]
MQYSISWARLIRGVAVFSVALCVVLCCRGAATAAPALEYGSDAKVPPGAVRSVRATLTNDYKIDSLISGYKWTPTTITYSFYEDSVFGGAYYGTETNVREVSEAVKNNCRLIFAWYQTVINVTFVEVEESVSNVGLIRIMDSDNPGYAYAYYPFGNTMMSVAGDVHLKTTYDRLGDTNGFQHQPGQHGFVSLIHEIGHAMGLKHPHDSSPNLPAGEDTHTNTVMSYQFYGNSPGTLMAYDIKALQALYGVRDHRVSDTIYLFTRGALDQYSISGAVSLDPSGPTKQTIWDNGGYNSIDLSGIAASGSGYRLDLKPMGWLSTNDAFQTTYYTVGTSVGRDVAINRVVNSSGSDTIYANSAANLFAGYSPGRSVGNDVIFDATGTDVIDLSSYGASAVTQVTAGNDLRLELGGDGSITLKNYVVSGDRPTIQFVAGVTTMIVGDATVTEGDSGTKLLSIPVALSAPASGAISVDFATSDETATAGSDYVATSGTLSFAPGEASKIISITINGDTAVESDETLRVTLSNAVGAVSVVDSFGIGTLSNDDSPNQPPVAFASFSAASMRIPATVTMFGAGSVDPDGSIVSYDWDFGDGSSGSGATVAHIYASAGTFNVTLTVTDDDGASGTTSFSLSPSDSNNMLPEAVPTA